MHVSARQCTSVHVSARPYGESASEYTQVSIIMPIEGSRYSGIRQAQVRCDLLLHILLRLLLQLRLEDYIGNTKVRRIRGLNVSADDPHGRAPAGPP